MARRPGRVGLLLGGALLGFVVSLLFLYLYVDRARNRVVEERVRVALGLPREAFALEDIEPDGTLSILLRDVAFLDRGRDTIVSAPVARARLRVSSLSGSGPIVFDQGEVVRPNLRLTQNAAGEWNVFRIMAVEAGGEPVRGAAAGDEPRARPIVFRDLRIVDGRARIATPYTPPVSPPTGRFASLEQPERVRFGGRLYTIRNLTDLDARLAMVRVGGEAGYRVEIASATANVTNPDTRINALAGWIEDRGDQVVRFDINTFRTTHSTFSGEGSIATGGETPRYDVRLRAAPLDFRDLAGMGFPLPPQGTARFALGIETLSGGRTRWAVTDASVALLSSRASGRLTAITRPNGDVSFTDTRVTLDPLRIADLAALGYLDAPPLVGEVTGTIASLDEVEADRGGSLRVDLAARLVPRADPRAPASVVAARGVVGVRLGAETAFRFEGLRVEAEPLNLATLRPLMPETSPELLRGLIRGGATLTGTTRQLRIEGGDLAYAVGDAPETRLRGLSGEVTLQPALRYSLRATADPLALATLTELVPSLPFRSATLAGPIAISGTPEAASFDIDLDGAAGGIDARGRLTFGETLGFDVSGSLEAFRAGGVLASGVPAAAQGPVSGTFSARGTSREFRFGVDLTQGQGRVNLAGTIRNPGGPPQFDVAGRVDDFQIGVLVGRPGLLPGTVSGPIRLSGGGRQPYRFDVELRGPLGLLDVEGWYDPSGVPRYAVSGAVQGLDVSGLPGLAMLPRTRLTGTIAIEGRGTTPETFAGRLDFRAAPGSTVGGIPLEAGIARIEGREGVLRVDTLLFALRGARFEGRGALGLTRPADVPLQFTLQAADLARLRTLVPGGDTLALSGAVALAGNVTGTLRTPTIAANGTARALRYGDWAAQTLAFDAALTKEAAGWRGTARLEGGDVQLAFGNQRLERVTLETNLAPGLVSFGVTARRDAATDLAASGSLELRDGEVTGAFLQSLALRLGGTDWRLADRARVGFTAEDGLAVENLLLRRSGGAGPAWIAVDGRLPPTGTADLRVHVEGVELAEARQVFPTFPEAQGRLTLDFTVEGPVNDPRFSVRAHVDSLRYGGVAADSLALSADYAANRLSVNAGVRIADREILRAEGTVPMRFTLGGIVPGFDLLEEGPLTATVLADSLPLGLVVQGIPQLADGEGVAQARIEVRGTIGDPEVNGFATLADGAVTVVPLGVRWERIRGQVSLEGDLVRIDSLTARSGSDGWAFVDGTIRLDDPRSPQVYARVELRDFQVIDNDEVASLEADARVAISGRFPGAALTGTITLEDGTIYIPEIGEEVELDIVAADVGQLGADTITAAPGGATALLALVSPRDLIVEIGDAVWLESSDARIQIDGQVGVTRGAGTALLVTGDLEAERGTFDVPVGPIEREFEIESGRVQFFGTPDLNPALDIVASYQVPAVADAVPVTVFVNVQGTLQSPRISFSTDQIGTPIPEAEIALLILTGRRSNQLGGLTEGFLQELIFEQAIGGFLTGRLEEALIGTGIVDYVRVRSGASAAAAGATASGFGLDFLGPVTVELGKEVFDNTYVALQVADIFSDSWKLGGALDWEISRALSLRAAYEPVRRDPLLRNLRELEYQTTADLRWRFEYGRPKNAAPPTPRPPSDQPRPAEPSTPDPDERPTVPP